MHIAYTNGDGNVEIRGTDFANNKGTVTEVAAMYIKRFTDDGCADAIITETLPDSEYADCYKISNGELIICEDKVVIRQQKELLRAIDEDVEAKKYASITEEGERKKELVLAMTTLDELNDVNIETL